MSDLYLLAIDIQRDFCPGGSLPVPDGDLVVAPWNLLLTELRGKTRVAVFSRDFHPRQTTHFATYGGEWPEHCVMGTDGADFHPGLEVQSQDVVISKGMRKNDPGYSAYPGLMNHLVIAASSQFLVGGLATDYCVRATVLDLLTGGFSVDLVRDAIRAVDPTPGGTGEGALDEMASLGARVVSLEEALAEYR